MKYQSYKKNWEKIPPVITEVVLLNFFFATQCFREIAMLFLDALHTANINGVNKNQTLKVLSGSIIICHLCQKSSCTACMDLYFTCTAHLQTLLSAHTSGGDTH